MNFKYAPYSPSRLDTATCGYAFYHQYIDPNRSKVRKEGLAQARGSAVHEVFEKITQRLITDPNTIFNESDIRQWIVEATNRHPAAYQEITDVMDMAKLYIRKPPALLTSDAGIELRLAIKLKRKEDGSVATYMDPTIFDGQEVERPVFIECGYDDVDAIARGRADIMLISDDTTKAIVYDHKTQPNIEEADTFQMGFYAWVISRIYPFLAEISTVLHFARYGVYSEPKVWTPRDLYKIEDEFLTRAAIVESRTSYEATPHKHCQYCPYIAKCPAVAEFITVDENGNARVAANNLAILGSSHKAVKIAGLINVLEDVLASAKEELKEHVKASSPVAIPGKIYEFRKGEEGINWDTVNKKLRDQTYEIFAKYGVDPKVFMSFNQTASKTIWMTENEPLVKELAALFPRKTETKFAGYKG